MYLRNLIVENFGVFDGLHEFELAPLPASADNNRHLTVVSGHNGAGKSTLFQAMRLALYGSLALGDRVSQQDYNRYLADRLHHRKGHPMADEARVGLTYLYVQSGQSMGVEIERRWKRKGRTLIETLDVRRNGELLDMPSTDHQAWLLELVPPGLAPLCFFNAERLDEFANPELHNGQLGVSDILKGNHWAAL